jgi:hypothetical protein
VLLKNSCHNISSLCAFLKFMVFKQGAPQNHWFGPAGDPRGAGIGTPEAIKMVWSCHREIVVDELIPDNWVQTKPT